MSEHSWRGGFLIPQGLWSKQLLIGYLYVVVSLFERTHSVHLCDFRNATYKRRCWLPIYRPENGWVGCHALTLKKDVGCQSLNPKTGGWLPHPKTLKGDVGCQSISPKVNGGLVATP